MGDFSVCDPAAVNAGGIADTQSDGPLAQEIRELWLEAAYESGAPIPEPATAHAYSGKFVAPIPRSLHRALALGAEREGVSLNAYVTYLLAERHALTQNG